MSASANTSKKSMVLIAAVVIAILQLLVGGLVPVRAQHIDLLKEEASVKIPFKSINNLILIPVMLNNAVPLVFLLDTGVRTPILTERLYSDILNINYDRILSLRGAGGGNAVEAFVASNVKMLLPDVQVQNQSMLVLAEDYLEMGSQLGVPVHGIIGYELFARFVVKIDYENQMLTLYEPEKFRAPRGYERLPLSVEEFKPFIETTVVDEQGQTHTLKLLVDTGASHALLLHQENSAVALPAKTIYGSLGRGLLGDISGHIGRLPEFTVADQTFTEVLTSFPDEDSYSIKSQEQERNGTIGGEILGRFTVILDYPHNALYLHKPGRKNRPFVFNKTGITFTAKGIDLHQLEVTDVRENSTGAAAGIQVRDVLYKINGRRTEAMQMHEVGHLLRRKDGKKIRLVMLRQGQKYKVKLRLQDLI